MQGSLIQKSLTRPLKNYLIKFIFVVYTPQVACVYTKPDEYKTEIKVNEFHGALTVNNKIIMDCHCLGKSINIFNKKSIELEKKKSLS